MARALRAKPAWAGPRRNGLSAGMASEGASVDVQIVGAGLTGSLLATLLQREGVTVRVVDPTPERRGALPLALPIHPEAPSRFLAALGGAVGSELLAFAAAHRGLLPGFRPGPLEVQGEGELAAALTLGVEASPCPGGILVSGGGRFDLPSPLPVVPPGAHEVEVLTVGGHPWLHDKLWPVRLHQRRFQGTPLPHPRLTHHLGLWLWDSTAAGARWASPHLEVGEVALAGNDRVRALLDHLAGQVAADWAPAVEEHIFVVEESCDGLPIVGPLPGSARTVVCAGMGVAEATWAPACAAAVVAGLLGRPLNVPPALRATRLA